MSQKEIERRIFSIRGFQVMVDRDLAELYQVGTKVLNQSVKRNIARFPETFRFQLSDNEKSELVTNCDRFEVLKYSSANPYVFTEQGVAMLSAVLRSELAVAISIQIMTAFVEMRKVLTSHSGLMQRMERIERKQVQTDQKFDQIFNAIEAKIETPDQGIFFEGQVFDAYHLTSKIVRSAKENLVLIDNYIDEVTLTHLSKRTDGFKVLLLTKNSNKQLILDVKKANEQYGNFELHVFKKSHDRFLIVDNTNVYHLGASLKDLGKKWFAFSKMDKSSVDRIMNSVSQYVRR